MNRSCFAFCTLLVVLAGCLVASASARGEDGVSGAHVCPLAMNQCNDYQNNLALDCHWYDAAEDFAPSPGEDVSDSEESTEPVDGNTYYDDYWYEEDDVAPAVEASDADVAGDEADLGYDYHSEYDEGYDAEVYGIESLERSVNDAADVESLDEDFMDPLVPPAPVGNINDHYDDYDDFEENWYGYESYEKNRADSQADENVVEDALEYDEYWNDVESGDAAEVTGETRTEHDDNYDYENDITADPIEDTEEIEDETLSEDYWGESYQYEEVDSNFTDEDSQTDAVEPIDESIDDESYEGDYNEYEYNYEAWEPSDASVVEDDVPMEAKAADEDVDEERNWYDEYYEDYDYESYDERFRGSSDITPQEIPTEDYWGESIDQDEATSDDAAALPAVASGKYAVLMIAKVLDELGATLRSTSDRLIEFVETPVDVSRKDNNSGTR